MPKFVSALVAALATKSAAGLTVAALAAGATGAVVVGVSTGAIPGAFNESMQKQVEACKAAEPTNGKHGIGSCVASAARHHGSDARENNPGKGDKKPKPDAKPTHPSHPDNGKPGEDGRDDDAGKPDGAGEQGGDHSGRPGVPPAARPTPHSD